MPRKRPSALRATEPRLRQWVYERGPIDRMSPATSATINFLEHGYFRNFHVSQDSTRWHLSQYRQFLKQRGTQLRFVASVMPACPGCMYDDLACVRDALEAVVVRLPPRARGELRRRLTALDEELRRRTLPNLDPNCHTDWQGEPTPWWHRRMYVGD